MKSNGITNVNDVGKSIEAIGDFSRKAPIVRGFCKKKKISLKGNLKKIIVRLQTALMEGSIPLTEWICHMDKYRENGMQHIFFFKLNPDEMDYIEDLNDPPYVWEKLEEQGEERLYNESPCCRLDAETPKLDAVVHDSERQLLMFKWVENRHWKQKNKPKNERTVNFFRVNLLTGNAEIRIQRIKSGQGGNKKVREELEKYREVVSKFIDLDKFSPFMLEPVMRRMLISHAFPFRRWKIRVPGKAGPGSDKGEIKTVGIPKIFAAVGFTFRKIFASHLSINWPFGRNSKVLVELDGRTDQVFVHQECSEEFLESLFSIFQDFSSPMPQGKSLKKKKKIKKEEELGASERKVLEKFYDYMRATDQWKLSLNRLKQIAENMWIPFKDFVRALEYAGATPKSGIKYNVHRQGKKSSATNEEGVHETEQLSDIAEKMESEEKKGTTIVNSVIKNYHISFSQPPKKEAIPIGYRVLFSVVFVILGSTLSLLIMSEIFNGSEQMEMIMAAFIGIMIALLGIAVKIIGKEDLKIIIEILKWAMKGSGNLRFP